MIAKVGGELVHVPESDAERICAGIECEPNYIYTASFGSSRPRPTPRPTPTPTPSPSPTAPPGEKLDYSKGILKVQQAWNVSQGSRDIVVAVVDSGVSLDHPDLVQNLWVNEREKQGTKGVDDDGNGYVDDVYGYDFVNNRPNGNDDNGHGTHCAGIIGASLNGFGTAGIAPNVKIMALKFLDREGSGSTMAAIKAIDYAVANGAHVISNSWGGGGRSDFLDQAIQRAVARNILVTAAAGNERNNNDVTPSFPAGYLNVISVASTDERDALSEFSNYGRQSVMIAAPGSRIYSTYLNRRYETLSGTSMATPQVSGALALALAVNPNIHRGDLIQKLCDTSDRVVTGAVGCGRMNVLNLINAVK